MSYLIQTDRKTRLMDDALSRYPWGQKYKDVSKLENFSLLSCVLGATEDSLCRFDRYTTIDLVDRCWLNPFSDGSRYFIK